MAIRAEREQAERDALYDSMKILDGSPYRVLRTAIKPHPSTSIGR